MVPHRTAKLAVELPAVSTGCLRDSQLPQLTLSVMECIHHQELLSMHRIVQRKPCKLEVDPKEDAAACTQGHCPAALQDP